MFHSLRINEHLNQNHMKIKIEPFIIIRKQRWIMAHQMDWRTRSCLECHLLKRLKIWFGYLRYGIVLLLISTNSWWKIIIDFKCGASKKKKWRLFLWKVRRLQLLFLRFFSSQFVDNYRVASKNNRISCMKRQPNC